MALIACERNTFTEASGKTNTNVEADKNSNGTDLIYRMKFGNPFDQIGREHNIALDFIRKYILSNVKVGMSEQEFLNVAKDAFVYYFTYVSPFEKFNLFGVFLKPEFLSESEIREYASKQMQVLLSPSYNPYERLMTSEYLSTATKSYFKQISETNLADTKSTYSTVMQINKNINDKLAKEESLIAFAGTSVFRHSNDYWQLNEDKWLEIVNKVSGKQNHFGNKSKGAMSSTVMSDIAGAVTGAGSTWYFGSVCGPAGVGAAAVAGGIAGAVINSEISMVISCLDYIFSN